MEILKRWLFGDIDDRYEGPRNALYRSVIAALITFALGVIGQFALDLDGALPAAVISSGVWAVLRGKR